MLQSKTKPQAVVAIDDAEVEYLAKRHRGSPAIVRKIIRRIGSSERAAIEREIRKGMSRRYGAH